MSLEGICLHPVNSIAEAQEFWYVTTQSLAAAIALDCNTTSHNTLFAANLSFKHFNTTDDDEEDDKKDGYKRKQKGLNKCACHP